MRRLRVLVLAKTTALGGAERLLMNGLPYLDRERFDYRFAALDDGGPLAAACRSEGFPFARLPGRGPADPRAPWALRGTLVRDAVDVVHAHLPLPGAIARAAARGLPTRVVYTEHTTQDVYRAPSRWLNAASYGWQHAVIAVSERVRASAARVARRGPEIAVVPNGVDLACLDAEAAHPPDPPLPRGEGSVAIAVVASLQPVKGHDVLLAALRLLAARAGPPLDVWLAGDGPWRHRVAAGAAGLPAGVRAHLLGRRRDAFRLLAAADVAALPSRAEGHPLALLEALALGRAVVASAVGGVPEIVEAERTGLLVPAGDPRALADALGRLRDDAALRDRLGATARRSARARFDVRRNVAAVEALYLRLAGPRLSAPACRSRSGRSPRGAASAPRER